MTSAVMVFLVVVLLAPLAFGIYAYVIYPLLLRLVALVTPARPAPGEPTEWPMISITVPAYNEARSIRATIENLLAADYPADRREILVVSDASTDETDAIVGEYADRGVRLVRLAQRGGKTAAENAAGHAVRSDLIVNTDASVRILPDALKPLVRAFGDPTVGVASGRDVSVGDVAVEGNRGESGYVGYEMTLRAWETRVGSIIGASGCFYGFRRAVHDLSFPDALSRDFASVLIARERGFRSVSVDTALCLVPRTTSLDAEFRRKVRTMARGLSTLWYKRALLNPLRYGAFAWMLGSHKLARWLVYLALPPAAVALVILSTQSRLAALLLGLAAVGTLIGWAGVAWRARVPRPVALAGFAVASMVAGVLAWRDALMGRRRPIWDPTRRPV
jgi:cellulose synthase/poly-beta-1,6-N-acetylglucosamine synthase-like glycosyltransferase